MCTSIQVPGGVDAFQDATSSVKPKPVVNHGDVQLLLVTPPFGSVKAWKLTLYCCPPDAEPASTSAPATAATVPRITRPTLLRGRRKHVTRSPCRFLVGSLERGRQDRGWCLPRIVRQAEVTMRVGPVPPEYDNGR